MLAGPIVSRSRFSHPTEVSHPVMLVENCDARVRMVGGHTSGGKPRHLTRPSGDTPSLGHALEHQNKAGLGRNHLMFASSAEPHQSQNVSPGLIEMISGFLEKHSEIVQAHRELFLRINERNDGNFVFLVLRAFQEVPEPEHRVKRLHRFSKTMIPFYRRKL